MKKIHQEQIPSDWSQNCLLPPTALHDAGGTGRAGGPDAGIYRAFGGSEYYEGTVPGRTIRHCCGTGRPSIQISGF